jgi:hypothetical protein
MKRFCKARQAGEETFRLTALAHHRGTATLIATGGTMIKKWGMLCLVGSAVLFGGVVACGDDDDAENATATSTGVAQTSTSTPTEERDEETPTRTTTTSPGGTGTVGAGQVSAYCDAIVDAELLMTGGPETEDEAGIQAFVSDAEEALTEAAEAAPDDDAREAVENLRDVFVENVPTLQFEVFTSDEFLAAEEQVDAVTDSECDFEEMNVTAVDYEFDGVPDDTQEGITTIALQNDGEEMHEFAVIRVNVEETDLETLVQELSALSDEEFAQEGEFVGIAFAAPGEESTTHMKFEEPGRYIVVCFISQGTTSPDSEGSGPPHAELGMVDEFTVE